MFVLLVAGVVFVSYASFVHAGLPRWGYQAIIDIAWRIVPS